MSGLRAVAGPALGTARPNATDEAPTMIDWADRDEGRHRPDHDGPGWSESFAFELVTVDGFAVAVHVTVHPFERRAWYWCVVARPDAPVVAVVDLDVPLPSRPASLELRTDGLWADHNVETPWRHVSVGLEAFGLALDDPRALLGDGRGDRVPVGLDLEWETEPTDVSDPAWPDATGYEIAGTAHGELLLGADAHELDGFGWRQHRWGAIDWWDPAPSARFWASSDRAHRRRARWTRGDAGIPMPSPARPLDGAHVEFPLPSFGDRVAVVGLGLAIGTRDPDAGIGWLSWRTTTHEGGSRP